METEANLGVMKEDCVNIIVHGHDPSLSEMIVKYSETPEMVAYAKEQGANGIQISGVCCTSNEVTMRHGIPMAGNFLAQENVVLTGACEAIVVDVQCIFPALGPLSKCFHTKFITTSNICRQPDSEFIHFEPHNAKENAIAIIKMACENFKNRKKELVYIPQMKQKAVVGYSCEEIIHKLDGVTNSNVDDMGTYKPLVECVNSGVLRGAVAMVGCNNPKQRADFMHVELMKKLIANDIILVLSGCSAQAAAKAGLMDLRAKDLCGQGLKRVCELVGIPPVLHMGSCVDISRMMRLVCDLAHDMGCETYELPVVGCAPEWMSEKAVSIGNYVIGTGIDTFLGINPYTAGSEVVEGILKGSVADICGAKYFEEHDLDKLAQMMIDRIEEKRAALASCN
jgi:carbon-monoxide dehydrogenase catalytic subunit